MIQCKPPVTPWFNNQSLSGKRPVRIKLPQTRIQYLREVPGFRSAGHIYGLFDNTGGIVISCDSGQVHNMTIQARDVLLNPL